MRLAQISSRDAVLVNGAGGSIGAHAVQIARAMGGDVTGVDHTIKEAFVRRMGASDFEYTRVHARSRRSSGAREPQHAPERPKTRPGVCEEKATNVCIP